MRVMVLVHTGDRKGYEAGKMPKQELLANMGKFNEQLVNAGVMQAGEGLHPSTKATRLHFPGKGAAPRQTEGPFADSLVAGFWIWNVGSKAEALDWAKRAPMEDGATLEIRQIFDAEDFGPEIAQHERQLQQKLEKQQRR